MCTSLTVQFSHPEHAMLLVKQRVREIREDSPKLQNAFQQGSRAIALQTSER